MNLRYRCTSTFKGMVENDYGYESPITTNDVWSTTDGINWEKAPQPEFCPRNNHSSYVFNGEMFITSGAAFSTIPSGCNMPELYV
ncbi:MAG: hypothetical protein ACLFQB_11860 [Chitinispirillaceae bacterium]